MNIRFTITVFVLLLASSFAAHAQSVGFTYQAVAMDASRAQTFGHDSKGEILVNTKLSVRFSILEGAANGSIAYQEQHETQTDIFGIFRLVVGRGVIIMGTAIDDLNWGVVPYFLRVEIDLGDGFIEMGVEELFGSPYALGKESQKLTLTGNELSITNGNTVKLPDNSPTNELNTNFTLEGTEIKIQDAGGTKTVDLAGLFTSTTQDLALNGNELTITGKANPTKIDLSKYVDGDASSTNELQDLQLNGHVLSITNKSNATQIDLAQYLNSENLAEDVVDQFVSNNGYLTGESQNISTDGTPGNLTISDGSTISLNVNDADASATNELQNISTDGTAGNISISSGSTLNLNVNDADASPTNELQNLSLVNNVLTITGNAAATPIALTPYLDAAFRTTNNVTSNSPGNFELDDFVFGGPDLNSNGTKFFFDKSKYALRVGSTNNNAFSDINIGIGSFGFGYNAIASGVGALSLGSGSVAAGDGAIALGHSNQSNGYYSIAAGQWNVANGYSSTALGYSSTVDATASRSVALGGVNNISGWGGVGIGNRLNSRSTSEIVLGFGNTDVAGSNSSWVLTDRLFVVGNGTPTLGSMLEPPNRSDALVMLKNGNTRLHGQLTIDADNVSGAGGSYTLPGQRGTNGQVMVTNGSGVLSWSTLPVPAFNTAAGVTSNSPGNYASDDFVFGSPQLADNGNASHDSRMFFDKSKGAFRAGIESSSDWNDINVGSNSVAFNGSRASGSNSSAFGSSVASGNYSFAAGESTYATGSHSIGIGYSSIASGSYSVAMGGASGASNSYAVALGNQSSASGHSAVALGSGTASGGSSFAVGPSSVASAICATAIGNAAAAGGEMSVAIGQLASTTAHQSLALGNGTLADSYGQVSIGRMNTSLGGQSVTSVVPSDRLFVVGNGIDAANRSDALIIQKNGNTRVHGLFTIDADNVSGLGGSYTFPGQRGTNGQVMVTNGSGVLSWSTLPVPAFNTAAGVTSNSPGNFATDDFVFGSPMLDDDGDPSHDSRMFFDKDKQAFRAGSVDGSQWDNANRGPYSVALGQNTSASGLASTAFGRSSSATGNYSHVSGINSTSSGNFSFAHGDYAIASGGAAIAIGTAVTASATSSIALGNFALAYGQGSIVIGSNSSAPQDFSIALGVGVTASGYSSVAIGQNSVASGQNSMALNGAQASGNLALGLGTRIYARSYGETGLGFNGTNVNPISTANWQATDRLFFIGNGVNSALPSDAFVMLKNGNTRLHGLFTIDADNVSGPGLSYTFPGQRGTNGQVMVTDGSGNLSWSNIDASASNEIQDLNLTNNTLSITNNPAATNINLAPYLDAAFRTTSNVTSNSPGIFGTDDFVFGSASLDDDGDATHDNRMFFDKSKGAFRAGTTDGSEWNDTERGANSIAMGNGSIARGDHSLSLGLHNLAHAASTVAIGTNVQAEAYNSVAIGRNVSATGAHSMGLAFYSAARSFGETVLGINATDVAALSTTDYNANDRLLTIGNGQFGAPSDALTILKNGNVTLHGNVTIDADNIGGATGYTLPGQDGVAGSFIATDGNGISQWTNSIPDLTVTNTFTNMSDQRLKRNIRPLQNVNSRIQRINGYTYQWNATSKQDSLSLQTGLLAQEVEKVFPELVKTDEQGYKSVNYIGLIPHLLEAIKELQKENDDLKQKNNALESQTAALASNFSERLQKLEQILIQAKSNGRSSD